MSLCPRNQFASLPLVVCAFSLFEASGVLAQATPAPIRWKKHAVNDQSPFEACGAADFNADGKIDIFSGDSWYESPKWTRHKVREVPASAANPHYYEDFCDAPLDVNSDGRPDIVTCNYFSARVGWVENPGGDATSPWREHEIDTPGNMETGVLVDINADGKLDFLPNTANVLVWYELTQQTPTAVWTKHDLGSEGAGHGVGFGDINRDGRMDIITPNGWREQPAEASDLWPFHTEFQLGAAGILILGRDIDGDELTDVIWGMGHDFGLFWLKQSVDAQGKRTWTKRTIDDTFSQVHTLAFANLDGEGEEELVTGKRVYAHEVEPGDTRPAVVFSYRFDRAASQWIKQEIFHGDPARNAPADAKDRWALKDFPPGSAGTGLQMATVDIDADGDIDIICPGKSGLYLFENLGR